MTSLDDFIVNEKKVWFTGGYWPEGVPHQLKDVEGVEITPLWDSFISKYK